MKRRFALILALALALAPATAHAQPFCLFWSDAESGAQYSILMDEQGQPLTDPADYSQIYPVDQANGWYAAYSVGEFGAGFSGDSATYALMNASGQTLTEEKYALLCAAYADRVIFMEAAQGDPDSQYRYGILDETGGELLPASFSDICVDGAGGFFAMLIETDGACALYHIDHDGKAVDTGCLCPGFLPVAYDSLQAAMDPASGLCGYLNPELQWVIEPRYAAASSFENGLARVYRTGADGIDYAGLIDPEGREVLPCEFDWIVASGETIIATRSVDSGSVSEVYALDGELQFTYSGSLSDYGDWFCGWPSDADGSQLLDQQGNVVRTLSDNNSYFYCSSSSEDDAILFYYDGETGLCHRLSDPDSPDEAGYYWLGGCTLNGNPCCLAATANMLYDEQFDSWSPEWSSIRYGLLDAEGNVLIPLQYRSLECIYGTDYLAFEDESGHGAMDASGNVLYYRSNYMELMD